MQTTMPQTFIMITEPVHTSPLEERAWPDAIGEGWDSTFFPPTATELFPPPLDSDQASLSTSAQTDSIQADEPPQTDLIPVDLPPSLVDSRPPKQTPHEKCTSRFQKYYLAHKEEITARNQTYRQNHKAEIAAYDRAYYQTHKEEIAAYDRAYYQTHKEEIAAYHRAHYQARKRDSCTQSDSSAAQEKKSCVRAGLS